MIRFSMKDLPKIGTIVKIKPFKLLTLNIIEEDYEHPFYDKVGAVISLDMYNRNASKDNNYIPHREIHNLIPLHVEDDYYLIAPESLTIEVGIKNTKKRKTNKQKIFDKIDARINELKMQSLH